MTRIFLYPQLSTNSKRALTRLRKRFGQPYTYQPRGHLLERLARENNLTKEQVYQQLLRERRAILLDYGLSEVL
jgi:hypothetical protein